MIKMLIWPMSTLPKIAKLLFSMIYDFRNAKVLISGTAGKLPI